MTTRDIFFAAYLIESGTKLLDYSKNGRITEFHFDINEKELKNKINLYIDLILNQNIR
jgi:hypothetical protein